MKVSGKMTIGMAKVRNKWFTLWFSDSNIVWWFDRHVVLKLWRQIKASSKINPWKDMKDSSNLYESCSPK